MEVVTMEQAILEKNYGITTTMNKQEMSSQYGGVTDKVMATVSGEKVMIKGDTVKESLAEYFAYKLGEYLGLNINKVKLIDCGDLLGLSKICSVHWWEDDFKKQAACGRKLTDEERNKLEFFDAIINNDDRHGSNYGYVNDELFLIDHGLSKPWFQFAECEYSFQIKRALQCPYCQEIVEKFLSLTVEDFYNMLKLPAEIEVKYDEEIFDNIVNRMLDVQDYIIKLQTN
jgi:hypothetical protein